jgi:hypothetical protein
MASIRKLGWLMFSPASAPTFPQRRREDRDGCARRIAERRRIRSRHDRQWSTAAEVATASFKAAQEGENSMQVNSAMNSYVKIATPDQSIADAARLMAQIDAGALPVGENDRLAGIITDRDIAIRAVAAGRGPARRCARS